jgi:hypothetical protein
MTFFALLHVVSFLDNRRLLARLGWRISARQISPLLHCTVNQRYLFEKWFEKRS